MIRKVMFLSLLVLVLCLIGCGGDDSIAPIPTNIQQPNTTVLEGWVYVVGNELLISNTYLTSITNKSLTSSISDNKPVKDCEVKVGDQKKKTDENGHFEFNGLPEGEEDVYFDPSESENASQCPPVQEILVSKNQNQEQYTYQWQNWRIQVVPRKRAQHVGVPKQYKIICWHMGKTADTPPGLVLEWWYEYPDGSTENGSIIDANGIFTPALPTNNKERVKVHVTVRDLEGNNINDLVFDDPAHAYSEVKVLRGDGTDVGNLTGNVSKVTNYIVSDQAENVEGAIIALNGIDGIGITDQNGNYLINNVPPDQYQALMEYQTVTQNKDVVVEQPSTTLDFVITEDVTITPSPTPTLLPGQPTATPAPNPTATPIPPPTNTPIPVPTTIPTPYWHVQTSYPSTTPWRDIDYDNANNLWICGGDYVIKSTNGGTSWTNVSFGSNANSVAVLDSSNIIVTSSSGNIYKTVNAGTNWTSIFTGTGANLMCNYFINGLFGAVAGDNSQIKSTSNAGTNWSGNAVNGFTIAVRDCEFTSQTTGFAGGIQTGGVGGIHRTLNGGMNWSPMTVPTGTGGIYSMCFIGSTSWACGNQGTIVISWNDGVNWTKINQPYTTQALNGIDMTNGSVGWIVGSDGVILYTTNGGTSWTQQESFTTNNLNEVIALDPNHAWAVGANGTILEYCYD